MVKCLKVVQKLNFRSLLLRITLRGGGGGIILITFPPLKQDGEMCSCRVLAAPTSVFCLFCVYYILQRYELLYRGAVFHAEYFHVGFVQYLAAKELHSSQPTSFHSYLLSIAVDLTTSDYWKNSKRQLEALGKMSLTRFGTELSFEFTL